MTIAAVIVPESGARRLTRLIKEVTIGSTPTGAWDILRTTGGDGVSAEIETTASNELSGSGALGVRDQIRTGSTGNFTYPCELSKDTPFETMMESLLQQPTWVSDVLLPGQTDVTMTIEDELPSVKEFEYLRGARCNAMQLTVNANEIVTAEFSGAGTDPGVVSGTGPQAVTLAGQVVTDASVPPTLAAGDFVWLTDAASPSDNGYYEISDVTGNDITVKTAGGQVFAGATANATYTGQSLGTGGSDNPKGTNTPFSAGSFVKLELSEDAGANWFDSLDYGWRVPSLTLNIATEVSDLREITEDAAYVQVAVNRPIEIQFNWHVVNLSPIRILNDDQEFGLALQVADAASNFYRFEFPRCKFSESSKGPAANGQEMTGNSNVAALLDSTDVNIRIERSA